MYVNQRRLGIMFVRVITLLLVSPMGNGEIEPNDYRFSRPTIAQTDQEGYLPQALKHNSYFYNSLQPHVSSDEELNDGTRNPRESLQPVTMQYAPLLRAEDLQSNMSYYSQYQNSYELIVPDASEEDIVKKNHLEPAVNSVSTELLPQSYKNFKYVPGHNIEVLKAVNRESVQNTVYRNKPGMQDELSSKQVKFIIREKSNAHTKPPEEITPTPAATYAKTVNNVQDRLVFNQFVAYGPKTGFKTVDSVLKKYPDFTNERNGSLEIIKPRVEVAPYPKPPILMLNVARTYTLQNPSKNFYYRSYINSQHRRLTSYKRSLLKALERFYNNPPHHYENIARPMPTKSRIWIN